MRREKLNATYLGQLTTAAQSIYPDVRTISGCPTDPEVMIQARSTRLICSPKYLGLAAHPAVITAFQDATLRFGAATFGSGIISGYSAPHQKVAEDLARFMNEEAATFFDAVSDASAGVISAIVNPPLLPILEGVSGDQLGPCSVFVDSQSYASILDEKLLPKSLPGKRANCRDRNFSQVIRRAQELNEDQRGSNLDRAGTQ